MKKYIFILLILSIFISFGDAALGYNTKVHYLMNEQAAKSYIINGNTVWASQLNLFLQDHIGIADGVETDLKIEKLTKQIWKWIAVGGEKEDSGKRWLNHFHDPLKDWDHAGLWDLGYPLPVAWFSSILWGIENHNQDPDDDWSWEKAKQYYYAYLTGKDYYGNVVAGSKDEREACLAKCFRAVGQTMHLLQDASVPDHTRNDAHVIPLFNVGGKIYYGTYETHTLSNAEHLDYIPDQSGDHPDPLLLGMPSPDPNYAHLPAVSGLFDRNQYNADDPIPAKDAAIGLAEYSNPNFLTQDTMWTYPHPVLSDLDYDPDVWLNPEEVDAEDGEKDNRIYFGKSVGEPIRHLAAAAYWYYQLYMWNKPELRYAYILDEVCFADYAAKLIPKAVGYSAELLDYFFRGRLEINLSEEAVNGPTFKLLAKNISLYGDEMNSGVIELVIRYQISGSTFYMAVPEQKGLRAIPKNEFIELDFDLVSNPIPPEASDIFLLVVYKGLLGRENHGIGSGGRMLFSWTEPWSVNLCDNHDWNVDYFIGSGTYTNTLCPDVPHHRSFSNLVKSTSLDILIEDGVLKMDGSGSSNFGESVFMWSQISWSAATEQDRIPSNSTLRIKVDKADVSLGNPTGDSWAACYVELWTAGHDYLTLCFGCDISSWYDSWLWCTPCELRDEAVHLHGVGEKTINLRDYFAPGDNITDIIIYTEIDEDVSTSGSFGFHVDYIKFE